MIKIRVQRENILATTYSNGSISVKSFDESKIKNGKLFSMNTKNYSTISGMVKVGNCLHTQKNGKITAQYRILEVL